jgi:ribose/xylose/arabinose/galactoside ABC-type transport system permease subunit
MSQATQQATPQEKAPGASNLLRRIFRTREIGVFVALLVLCVAMSFASPYFLKPQNLFNVLRGMSTIGIMAIGRLVTRADIVTAENIDQFWTAP